MVDFHKMIAEAAARNKELTSMTVRVPETMRSFIEEFSENMSLSRQEVLLDLLKAGIVEVKKALDSQNGAETASSFHILNTNKSNNDEDQEMMLAEGIAAAFYDPWKTNINRIKKDDWVFLYENRKGIIAFGQGTGKTLERDHDGQANECFYQELKDFKVISKPLTASEIKSVLGRNQIFLRTMSGMPDGHKVLAKLQGSGRK